MYFSRVRLNPTRRATRKLVTSAQAMHATILGSHSPHDAPDGGRILWRLDQLARHDLQLYVVSPSQPDFTGLLEQAGWPTNPTWETTNYGHFLERLAAGQEWRFRVTANPVRAVKNDAPDRGSRGRVSPHLTVAQQEQWLSDRAGGWGFSLPSNTLGALQAALAERHTASFSRGAPAADGRPGRDRVTISRATFEGVLTVKDADLLRHSLTHGMGRAKAYGCGLMTLAPAR